MISGVYYGLCALSLSFSRTYKIPCASPAAPLRRRIRQIDSFSRRVSKSQREWNPMRWTARKPKLRPFRHHAYGYDLSSLNADSRSPVGIFEWIRDAMRCDADAWECSVSGMFSASRFGYCRTRDSHCSAVSVLNCYVYTNIFVKERAIRFRAII